MKKVILVSLVVALSACGGSTKPSVDRKVNVKYTKTFGMSGKHKVSFEYHGGTKVFFPTDISKQHPTPVVFFVPGYNMFASDNYKTVINFIASHGYTVIYAPDKKILDKADWYVELVTKAAKESGVAPYIDTTRIGVIGHSLGGGNTFYVLDKLSKNEGWGDNGRFILALDPYFPYGMSEVDLQNLPQDTNIVVQKYGFRRSDPRIALTTYYGLDSIPDNKKDYQVYKDVNHFYVTGDKAVSNYQHTLKPLDALLSYTFEKNENARATALEVGSDDPIGANLEEIKSRDSYQYKCNSAYGNRFCKILN